MEVKDYIQNIPNAERRFAVSGLEKRVEKRDDDTEKETVIIRGYAALFDTPTDLGWYKEVIVKGAFDNCLTNDVRGLFNHDMNFILGRGTNAQDAFAKTETLKYGIDSKGLWYEIILDMEISYHRDLFKSIERGDVKQSSFAFVVEETAWVQTDIGEPNIRKIVKVKELYDVSPVTYPAYADTTVAKRSAPNQSQQNADLSVYQKAIELKRKQLNQQ